MRIQIEGFDECGQYVTFECEIIEGTITTNGHCKFIDETNANTRKDIPARK